MANRLCTDGAGRCAVAWSAKLLFFVIPMAAQIQSVHSFLFDGLRYLLHDTILLSWGGALVLLGCVAFDPRRRIPWVLLVVTLILSLIGKNQYPFELSSYVQECNQVAYQTITAQLVVLVFPPLLVILAKSSFPVEQWIKASLLCVLIIQTAATLNQLLFLKLGRLAQLKEWYLWPGWIYSVKDSRNVYEGATRLTGLVIRPNFLGTILLLTWPVLICASDDKKDTPLYRLMKFGAVGCVALALVLTYARSAYMGLFLQLVALLVLYVVRRRTMLLHAMIAMTVTFLLALMAVPFSAGRVAAITDVADRSILHRLWAYQVAFRAILDRPVSGGGPGYFNVTYNLFHKLPYESYSYFDCNSWLFHIVLTIGLGGLSLLLITCTTPMLRAFFRRLPMWAWLGPLGASVSAVSDNPGTHFAVCVPAAWIMTVWMMTAAQCDSDHDQVVAGETRRPLARTAWTWSAGGIFVLWLIGWAQPFKAPEVAFAESLRNLWPAGTNKLAYHIRNLRTGAEYSLNADSPTLSAVKTKLVSMSAAMSDPNSSQTMVSSSEQATGDTITSNAVLLRSTPRDDVALLLSLVDSTSSASQAVVQVLARDSDRTGLDRYLCCHANLSYVCVSESSEDSHSGVFVMNTPPFVIAVSAQVPSQCNGVDHPGRIALAKTAWMSYLFFNNSQPPDPAHSSPRSTR